MKLQILVNHYNESKEMVSRFLSSLAMQRDVDFSVILCSDGGKKLKKKFLNKFNLDINYHYLSHAGVCTTRNIMMDMSDADYIMFCDIDDCFNTDNGLLKLVEAAKKTNADIISSPYICESLKNGKYYYTTYEHDIIRVHGKIFKYNYLIENNIRFPDELETSGDMMFLWLAFALTKNSIWIKDVFYTWKHNPNSVTRGIDYSSVVQYPRTLKCYELLYKELIKRENQHLIDMLISVIVPMMYLDVNSGNWDGANKKDKQIAMQAVAKCLEWAYIPYLQLSDNFRRKAYKAETECKINCKSQKGYDGIAEWAKNILVLTIKKDILIIGHGVVGTNLEKELSILKPDVYDKYKNIDNRNLTGYHIAFICVNTPYTEDNPCDISEIYNAIIENTADIYVIKSTILPGTVEKLKEKTGKRIIFSPEYYGDTQHCNNFDFNFTILGGDKKDCIEVQQLLQKVYDGRHIFRIVDSKTAELAKYMENCWLATKVSFCNQFFDIANNINVDYENLRELFILDPRVNPSHTFVYNNHPYWSSHCLDKDIQAIAETQNAPLLNAIITFNNKRKMEGVDG